ncbi:hypothetical protein LTR62_001038 [Meristemomyces frigidus]|uniref:Uncharacterized protein n=1 Tax=Meristemomyces frigidus TaxID=1508187 RepID=A0AAN7YL90_9PEZI|nr:hypothetical protein LTR62_001038 [Meristemomyces frigidus]
MATAQTTELVSTAYAAFNTTHIQTAYQAQTVPPRQIHNGMKHYQTAIPLPCSDCLITAMQAQLLYPNGSLADASTGIWLHHVVLLNAARQDSVCASAAAQRFFASGNERTKVDLTNQGTRKIGYPIQTNDSLVMAVELMNMRTTPQEVQLSMLWDYIPSIPHDFKQAVPYWLDISGCGNSEMPAFADQKFHYSSPAVPAGFDGEVVFIAAHLHDGGTEVSVLRNGIRACTAYATYGSSGDGAAHITTMQTCLNVGRVKKGQRWAVTAEYDTVMHKPMVTNEGALEPVMGIALAYVIPSSRSAGLGVSRGLVVMAIVLVVLFTGLLGLYIVRTYWVQSLPDRIRRRGWQRVNATGEAEDEEVEEALLQCHGQDGSARSLEGVK